MKSRQACLGNPNEKDEWLFNPESGFSCHSGLMENNGQQHRIAGSRNLVIFLSETRHSYLFVTELFRYKYAELCPIIAWTRRLQPFRIVSFVIFLLSPLKTKVIYLSKLNRDKFNKCDLIGNFYLVNNWIEDLTLIRDCTLESKRRNWRKKQIPVENLLIDCWMEKKTTVTIAILLKLWRFSLQNFSKSELVIV